jgi:hypothetical protein
MVLPDMDHPAVWLILNTSIAHTTIVGTTMPRPIGRQPGGRDVSRTESDCLNPRPRKCEPGRGSAVFSDNVRSFKCLLGAACVR